MHCQRQHRRERGIATTHLARRFIQVAIHWAIRNCQATRVNHGMDRATRQVVIVHRTFHHRNHRHVIQSTTVKHRRLSKVNAACGTLATLAS